MGKVFRPFLFMFRGEVAAEVIVVESPPNSQPSPPFSGHLHQPVSTPPQQVTSPASTPTSLASAVDRQESPPCLFEEFHGESASLLG